MKALIFNFNIPQYLAIRALSPLSKRICFQGPLATIRLRDIPEPKLPSPEWVKIKTRLCGFCGSDLSLILLRDSPAASPFSSFPCVTGHEVCGDVVEAGPAVKNCKVGDFVTIAPILNCVTRGITPECKSCSSGRPASCENSAEGAFSPGMFHGLCRDIGGGFAEYFVAHASQVYRIPEGISPESAVMVEPFAVGLQAVLDNLPEKRDKVLVIGGGVIGLMVVKAIRGLGIGCDITVAEPSGFNAGYARTSGADRVVQDGLIEVAEKITGGRAYQPVLGEKIMAGGFDKVFDTVGHTETLNVALRVTATQGALSLIGIGRQIKLDPTPIWLKQMRIRGCLGYGFNPTAQGKRHAFEIALELLGRKQVAVEDMLTHKFQLGQYQDMVEVNLNKSKNKALKTAVFF